MWVFFAFTSSIRNASRDPPPPCTDGAHVCVSAWQCLVIITHRPTRHQPDNDHNAWWRVINWRPDSTTTTTLLSCPPTIGVICCRGIACVRSTISSIWEYVSVSKIRCARTKPACKWIRGREPGNNRRYMRVNIRKYRRRIKGKGTYGRDFSEHPCRDEDVLLCARRGFDWRIQWWGDGPVTSSSLQLCRWATDARWKDNHSIDHLRIYPAAVQLSRLLK